MNLRNHCVLAALTGLLLAGSGCDSLRMANQEECTAVVDHLFELEGEKHFGPGFAGRLAGKGASTVGALTGDRRRFIRKCMGSMPKFYTNCLLRADDVAEAERCSKKPVRLSRR